jgi:outer membrane receptor for ferrienterochelin and colicins
MHTYRNVFLFVASLFAFSVQAEQPPVAEEDLMLLYENEEMVSIATGTVKPIHLAPSVASVITARDIEASGARTLDEVLETVPGLHVSKSSARNSSIYSIRGIHTDQNPQVLLLVNGLPFNDIITGSRPPLFRLPVENISRIEIIRGPGSAVFGADAFAGVINVITKDGSDINGTVVGGRGGSFDTRDGWAQYGNEIRGWDVGVSVEYSISDGDRDRIINSDLQTILDAGFGTSASQAPGPLESGYRLLNSSVTAKKDNWAVWINSWNLSDAGVGPGAAQALDPVGRQDVDQYLLKIDYSNGDLVKDWHLDSTFSYRVMDQIVNYQILPPGATVTLGADGNLCFPPSCTPTALVNFPDGVLGNPGGKLKDSHLEVAGLYEGWLDHRMRVALGVDKDEVKGRESKNFGPGTPAEGLVGVASIDGTLTDVTGTDYIFAQDRSRVVRYLSLQDEWRAGRDWELTAGVRYDSYSDFGDTTNPRLALVWATDYNLTSKLLYGRAFRAPSMTELYFENNPTVIGNPNLEPEQIDMVELAFDYRPTFDLETVLSLYSYRAKRLIEFVNGVAQNNRNQDGHGLELEATWQASNDLKVMGNFALQYSEDADTGDVIANAPRRQLFFATEWHLISAWSLYGQGNWVMDRSRAVGDPRPPIDDYATVDLALHYRPGDRTWDLAVSIKNAFDQDARESSPYDSTAPQGALIPDDYPLEGRSFYLQARYHMN